MIEIWNEIRGFFLLPQNWPVAGMGLFLIVRLFPEVKQFLPEILAVFQGQKQWSDIKFVERELTYFDRKVSYIAKENINPADCNFFFSGLAGKVEKARASSLPISFSFCNIRRINKAGSDGLKKLIHTACSKNQTVVLFIFPEMEEGSELHELLKYTLTQKETEKASMVEIIVKNQGLNDDIAE